MQRCTRCGKEGPDEQPVCLRCGGITLSIPISYSGPLSVVVLRGETIGDLCLS